MFHQETAGVLLKRARLAKALSPETISEQSGIDVESLTALEQGNWGVFNARIHAVGLSKKYATVLGLDPEYIGSLIRRDFVLNSPAHVMEYDFAEDKRQDNRDYAKPMAILILIVAFIFFSYQVALSLKPPSIQLISPNALRLKAVDKVLVKGKTDSETEVLINDQPAFVEKDGAFYKEVMLKRGSNPVRIRAIGANGRTATVNTAIVVD